MSSRRPSPLLLLPLVLLLGACASTVPTADDDRRVEGNLVFEHVPEIPDALVERLRQYRATRSAALAGWLPDGSALITTRFGETRQVHRVERPGGARTQLTFFDEPVSGVEPSPDADAPGFLFGRDVGGSEAWQVFHFDLASGAATRLTDGTSRNSSAVFSADGARMAYASTRRNGVDTDVWVSGLEPDSARLVTEEAGSWYPIEFSPEGGRLLVLRYVSRSEAHPYVVDLDDGSMRAVLPRGVTARIEEVGFAPDGEALYLASDLGGEFVRLWRLDAPGADPEPVSGRVAHDVEGFELSPDGRYLVWVVNEETLSRLYARDLEAGTFVALPRLPEGIVHGLAFTPDSRTLGFTVNGSTSPGDVWALGMDSRRLTRWTTSEVGGLDRETFVTPDHFRFPTFDALPGGARDGDDADARRTIPAYVYRPRGEGPHPVIVSIHGGPESEARPYFSSTIQFWVNELGAAVIRPNVRGSTGYGRSFHRLDDGMRREDSVRDIGALLDWIARQEDLDADRVIVTGGSYGGYMVLASMTLFPERIAAGVETVGISNFVTFLENTRDYRRDLRRAEYGDERDPAMRAFLQEISPLNRVERIDAPLLVIQGANDPRVPASESEQIVEALEAAGQEVWYLLALDEGHGFRKRGNQDVQAAVTALFLERVLERAL